MGLASADPEIRPERKLIAWELVQEAQGPGGETRSVGRPIQVHHEWPLTTPVRAVPQEWQGHRLNRQILSFILRAVLQLSGAFRSLLEVQKPARVRKP